MGLEGDTEPHGLVVAAPGWNTRGLSAEDSSGRRDHPVPLSGPLDRAGNFLQHCPVPFQDAIDDLDRW